MAFKGSEHIRAKTITDPTVRGTDKRILTT
jgi:hypothetical protein